MRRARAGVPPLRPVRRQCVSAESRHHPCKGPNLRCNVDDTRGREDRRPVGDRCLRVSMCCLPRCPLERGVDSRAPSTPTGFRLAVPNVELLEYSSRAAGDSRRAGMAIAPGVRGALPACGGPPGCSLGPPKRIPPLERRPASAAAAPPRHPRSRGIPAGRVVNPRPLPQAPNPSVVSFDLTPRPPFRSALSSATIDTPDVAAAHPAGSRTSTLLRYRPRCLENNRVRPGRAARRPPGAEGGRGPSASTSTPDIWPPRPLGGRALDCGHLARFAKHRTPPP